MAKSEIERKFLVAEGWKNRVSIAMSVRYKQAYISLEGPEVRVRIDGAKTMMTIKGAREGFTRSELELEIPFNAAQEAVRRYNHQSIDKTRHHVRLGDRTWEVDEFHGRNQGLVIAEIELEREGESLDLPAWIGKEVTDNSAYYNASLAVRPFSEW